MATTAKTDELKAQEHEYRALVRRAEAGDEAALPALRKLYDHVPALWQVAGNLAQQAEYSWIKTAMGRCR